MKTVTVTRDMLVWRNDRSGLYKTPQGYALLEYATGYVRWMSARQAKNLIKIHSWHLNTGILIVR